MAAVSGVASLAQAQSNDVLNRINRLENELDTLNRAVYKGEQPAMPTQIPSAPPTPLYNTSSGGASNLGGVEIRIQQMENQVRELTGQMELQTYEIDQVKERLDTIIARMDAQQEQQQQQAAAQPPQNPFGAVDIKPPEIKGMQTILPGGKNETSLYEQSFAALKAERFSHAQDGFEDFLEQYPNHALASNAKYWLGETFYVQGKYDAAAKVFAQGFQSYPESTKSPDILLKLGMSLAGMGKTRDACVALSQVKVKFPNGYDAVVDRAAKEQQKLSCSA